MLSSFREMVAEVVYKMQLMKLKSLMIQLMSLSVIRKRISIFSREERRHLHLGTYTWTRRRLPPDWIWFRLIQMSIC